MIKYINKIVGNIRGGVVQHIRENQEDDQLHLNNRGELIVNQTLPPLTEIVRLGDSWMTNSAGYSAATQTALAVVPSTAGKFALWNGESPGGKSYVIDSLVLQRLVLQVTNDDTYALWLQILPAPVVSPPTAESLIVTTTNPFNNAKVSLCGKPNYTGRGRCYITSAATLANAWDCVGTSPNKSSSIAGSIWSTIEVSVFGRYIIPPGAEIAFHVTEGTAEASGFNICVRWHEVRLPIIA